MKFKVWLESWSNFTASHFQNPYDQNTLLVFADWLDDQGENHFANAIRHILRGHDEKQSKDWLEKANDLMAPIWKELKANKVTLPANGDSFKIDRKTYYVRQGTAERSISELKKGQYIPLSPDRWTPLILKAAIYIILRNLTTVRPQRYRDEDVHTISRSSSLIERNFQSRLHNFAKRLNDFVSFDTDMTAGRMHELGNISRDAHMLNVFASDLYGKIDPQKYQAEILQINGLAEDLRHLDNEEIRISPTITFVARYLTQWLNQFISLNLRSNPEG